VGCSKNNTVRRLAVTLLFVALGAGVVVPSALAEPLRANVVSVSPNDIDQPDVPVSIVFHLYKVELPSPPTWGTPIAGVNDVEVVIRGEGQTRRFRTEDLGGGRYRTQIVFPEPGSWAIHVSYGVGRYGPGDEIILGKGAICIAADCVGPQPGDGAPADGRGWLWTTIMIVAAVLLAVPLLSAAGLVRFGAVGRRRRVAPTA
jgi:hypothetical protein